MNATARICCAALACSAYACSPSVDFERMREQARPAPYSASPVFADAATMRTPPPGTVPIAAGSSIADVIRGEQVFQVYCVVCHASDGAGHTAMAHNMPGEQLSLTTAATAGKTDADLLQVIAAGQKRMPAFAWAVPSADRQAALVYLRQLQNTAARGATDPHARA